MLRLVGVMMVVLAGQPEDSAKDLKALQGTWSGSYVEGGKPLADKEKAVKVKLVVKADKYTVFLDDAKAAEGQIKLDASKKPRTIDAVAAGGPLKGMVQQGIYALEGDELRVLFSKPGEARPTEFKAREGTDQMLAKFRRVK
jgi:uncharacterized protein (TIGR03067 family)